jgi:uncharacterized protein
MNIWLDNLLSNSDKRSYVDCDCLHSSYIYAHAALSGQEADEQQIQTQVLRWASPLHVQECAPERWLVCNPVGIGRIAVLDREAMQLLRYFTTPITIAQVARLTLAWELQQLVRAATLFLRAGFLVDADNDQPTLLAQEVPELTAWIHLTNECNLRCSYCYLGKTSEHMSSDTARKAAEAVFRSAKAHNFQQVNLKYAGGEASLHMQSVLNTHDYAVQLAQQNDMRLEAVLLSNGVVLSQQAIEALKERHIRIMISLDGLDASHDSQRMFINGHGSARYVRRTIERLIASDLRPHISITVSRRNLAGLPELLDYILKRDLTFSLSYYRENAYSEHFTDLRIEEQQLIKAMQAAFKIIEQSLPKRSLLGSLLDKADLSAAHSHTCGVGHNYLVIDQHGCIAKCQADIGRTITTISADDPLAAIRSDQKGVQGLPVDQKTGCRTCEWRNWCTGGCPLLTYRATGRYDVQSPNCNIYKALFPQVLRLEALRLLRDIVPINFNPSISIPPATLSPPVYSAGS